MPGTADPCSEKEDKKTTMLSGSSVERGLHAFSVCTQASYKFRRHCLTACTADAKPTARHHICHIATGQPKHATGGSLHTVSVCKHRVTMTSIAEEKSSGSDDTAGWQEESIWQCVMAEEHQKQRWKSVVCSPGLLRQS